MSSSKTNSEAKPSRRQDFDFVSLVDSMTAAAELPDKSDMGFHRTLDRKFAKGIDATSARVLKLTNQLLELAVQSPELDANNDGKAKVHAPLDDEDTVVDHFRSSVIDIVDRLLENAVSCDRLIQAQGDLLTS
jgi:exosome complex exonuclease RRP6